MYIWPNGTLVSLELMASPAGILAKNSNLLYTKRTKKTNKQKKTPEFKYEGAIHPEMKTQSLSTVQK